MIDPALESVVPALEAWLARERDGERARVHRLRSLGGGAVQENWLLEASIDGAAEHETLVLRTDASSAIDDSAASRYLPSAAYQAALMPSAALPTMGTMPKMSRVCWSRVASRTSTV